MYKPFFAIFRKNGQPNLSTRAALEQSEYFRYRGNLFGFIYPFITVLFPPKFMTNASTLIL